MKVVTRVILQPRGGGEPLESFDHVEREEAEIDTLLSLYQSRFGEPIEVALTDAPGVEGAVGIGWLFDVPANFDVPGSPDQFEMVLIPMIDDPDTAERVSLFLRLAEQRQDFQQAFDNGDLAAVITATLAQRALSESVKILDIHSQRHDDEKINLQTKPPGSQLP